MHPYKKSSLSFPKFNKALLPGGLTAIGVLKFIGQVVQNHWVSGPLLEVFTFV